MVNFKNQIKLRAWDRFNGCHYYSENFDKLSDFFLFIEKCQEGGNDIIIERSYTLKNGKTVYEGDVCVPLKRLIRHFYFKIVFDIDCLRLQFFQNRKYAHMYSTLSSLDVDENFDIEIIGNIHNFKKR